MAYIGREPQIGNYQVCDAISASATATYALAVGGTSVSPESANHMIVSLNGVIQKPVGSFTVSGSNIIFNSALTSSDSIDFIILLGSTLDVGIPSDASITNAKLASDVISGETDIGGAIADADLFLIDDGAGGTLRKTAASRIKTYAGGKVLQHKETSSSAVATGTTIFPEDDTIPQNDEGDEYMTLAITPVSATSTMYIAVQVFGSKSSGERWGISLYKDSGANSLAFTSVKTADATTMDNGTLRYAEVTGNTTARTYKVRCGSLVNAATFTFNGQSGNRKFGGVDTLSSIQILEVEA